MSAFVTYAPWLMSAITIWMTLLAGNKHRSAWAVGLCNQALWLAWILFKGPEVYGLLPMNAALWVAYAINLWKWSRK